MTTAGNFQDRLYRRLLSIERDADTRFTSRWCLFVMTVGGYLRDGNNMTAPADVLPLQNLFSIRVPGVVNSGSFPALSLGTGAMGNMGG